jgi:site-specific recombinase XerD
MLELIYTDATTIKKYRGMLFGPHLDSFVAARHSQGYAVQTLRHDLSYIHRFAEFLKADGKREIHQVTVKDVDRCVAAAKCRLSWRGSVHALLDHLVASNVLERSPLSAHTIVPNDRWTNLLNEYLRFLEHHRGLSASTIGARASWGRALFECLGKQLGDAPLGTITIGMIDAFVLERAAGVSRGYQHQMIQTVRSVLRYLRQEGQVSSDLASLVAAPRRYPDATLPIGLAPDQVSRVLNGVDRSTSIGVRDHSMLTLLSIYGLRASEVAALRLDDVDWKIDQIQIAQSKGRRKLVLPLVSEAGDAILAYIRDGRPMSQHRELFIRHKAPYSRMTSPAVYQIVRKAIDRAGVESLRRGPHLFRHTRATAWIRGGWSLKAVGDLLGHRCADTTRIYAKVAIEDLREVALNVPEVAR